MNIQKYLSFYPIRFLLDSGIFVTLLKEINVIITLILKTDLSLEYGKYYTSCNIMFSEGEEHHCQMLLQAGARTWDLSGDNFAPLGAAM